MVHPRTFSWRMCLFRKSWGFFLYEILRICHFFPCNPVFFSSDSNMSHPPVNARLKRKKIGALRWVPSHSSQWIPRRRQVEELKRRADERGLGWQSLGGFWGMKFFYLAILQKVTLLGWLVSPWETHISPWKWMAGRCHRFLLENPSDLVTSWKVGQVTDPTFGG